MAGMTGSFWQARRVFVTGATGMIGSWLVKDLLARNAHVVVLVLDADPQSELLRSGDLQRSTVVNGSLQDFSVLERAINLHEIDTVFHLAAQTIVEAAYRSPLQTFETNIRGTYNLLEACRAYSGRIKQVVIASSDKAYGEQTSLPYTEDMPLSGRHPYDVSKSCADALARAYHVTYELPVTIARCGNVYGGGDLNWSRIVPGTIRSLMRGERPELRSDGTYIRDYTYVKDVTRGYIHLAECTDEDRIRGEAFNFGSGTPMTVFEMVASIQRLMGLEKIKSVVRGDARGEIKNQFLSTEKARSVLGWEAHYGLEMGLKETIEWYRSFLEKSIEHGSYSSSTR
jgi:CDP-glucose 4,6-dehydratase